MPLEARIGIATEPCISDVTVRDTMAYAAGVGDPNPRYLDDSSGGVIAPPAFCSALEWPATIRLRQALALSREEALRGVHASQDSTFHAPIRPGERIRTTGSLAHVRETRAGALTIVRFDSLTDPSGEPRATTYAAFLYRGVSLSGESIGEEPAPLISALPEKTETHTLHIRPEAAHVYTECARIWNPIHTEREVARAAGLPDIILHGTALWALVARELVDRWCHGEPQRLRRLAGRFSAMVIPGTEVTLEHAEPDVDGRVPFILRNAEEAPAISAGNALLG
jgi:acyl dehydratase